MGDVEETNVEFEGTQELATESGSASQVRDRRGLLLGAAAGLGGLAAGVLAGSQPADAAQGDAVLLGQDNTGATARTGVFESTNTYAATLADAGNTAAVYGQESSTPGGYGVFGTSGNGVGVYGQSSGGDGVHGTTTDASAAGVLGLNGTASSIGAPGQAAGVWGDSATAAGVVGTSDSGSGVHGVAGTGHGDGVYGEAQGGGNGVHGHTDIAGAGVYGKTEMGGAGVWGEAGGSPYGALGTCSYGPLSPGAVAQSGVAGQDTSPAPGGYGVNGSSQFGTGVLGSSASATGVGVSALNAPGVALQVDGATTFTRSNIVTASGTSTAPLAYVDVTVPGAKLTAKSMLLATIQGQPVSGVAIASVSATLSGSYNTFRIHFTADLKTTMHIAWFVIN